MFLQAVLDMLQRASNLDSDKAWFFAVDIETQEHVISLNTEDQLGEDGIDALGRSLGEYAPFTVNERRSQGLQVGHIDFRVTGMYHNSWKVRVTSSAIFISVDDERFDELVNDLNFSKEHVGLTEENLSFIRAIILAKELEYANSQIFR